MDKALEKINELKQKLEVLYIERDNIKADINFNTNERNALFVEEDSLDKELEELNSEEKKIQDILKNIKKWKRNAILRMTFRLLICLVLAVVSNLGLAPTANIIGRVCMNALFVGGGAIGVLAVALTGPYYTSKKYLKTHKLEDIEKAIEENQKNIGLNAGKIAFLDFKLSELYDAEADIRRTIEATEEELRQLEDLRMSIINRVLNNNQEFEQIVNTEYESHKQKKLKPGRTGA